MEDVVGVGIHHALFVDIHVREMAAVIAVRIDGGHQGGVVEREGGTGAVLVGERGGEIACGDEDIAERDDEKHALGCYRSAVDLV